MSEQKNCKWCGKRFIPTDEEPDFCSGKCGDAAFEHEWKKEQAMEAGMLHGLDAYNEIMGYD